MDPSKLNGSLNKLNITKGRFDPTKLGLEENFSLLKFSTLKG